LESFINKYQIFGNSFKFNTFSNVKQEAVNQSTGIAKFHKSISLLIFTTS